eukprot:276105_1
MFVLLAGLLLNGVTASYQVLAAEDVCFSARTIDTNTLFSAPEDGEIKGMYLVHKSGGVTCGPGGANYNWGCWSGYHMVFLLRDNDTVNPSEILYPRVDLGTLDVVDTSHTCPTPCGLGAEPIWKYVPNILSNRNNITLEEPRWDVTTTQAFRLVYGEACCQTSTSNNAGTSCADVYFIYTTGAPTTDPTADPTADPTTDPTDDPTTDPTDDPTTDPTAAPSASPTNAPSAAPTATPTPYPTDGPTLAPTNAPTQDSEDDSYEYSMDDNSMDATAIGSESMIQPPIQRLILPMTQRLIQPMIQRLIQPMTQRVIQPPIQRLIQ